MGGVEAFSASASINKYSMGNFRAPSLCQVLCASFADLKRMYTEQQRKPSTKGKGNLQNELEKVFANSVSDKGLIFTIYKEYIQLNSEKTKNLIKKWAENPNGNFSPGRHTVSQQVHEKMLYVINHQENVNSSHSEIAPHTC